MGLTFMAEMRRSGILAAMAAVGALMLLVLFSVAFSYNKHSIVTQAVPSGVGASPITSGSLGGPLAQTSGLLDNVRRSVSAPLLAAASALDSAAIALLNGGASLARFAAQNATAQNTTQANYQSASGGASACYVNGTSYLFIKWATPASILIYRGNGACPAQFPGTGYQVWTAR